ncbi:hypothetical protein L0666_03780 [Octadecabacter sp. CECT 8868]|uniref:hypothetical protein n=1 Tax=Octadecabacter algicola TaxID=2909342 RepID=UPI001F262718|nr:hypothetical protein [Octadecabacter algicola]MCF2904097.1 hypothetical protein [Octadecabacter algicola]
MTEIKALIRLQELDAVIAPDGNAPVKDLSTWSSTSERVAHRRARIEGVALAGMNLGELHVFLARASHEAVGGWNAEQSWLGRIRNRMTIRFPGYAQVPGRILLQVMRAVGEEMKHVIVPASYYLLRADVAADLRDQIADLRETA